jgi:hypothetical protein
MNQSDIEKILALNDGKWLEYLFKGRYNAYSLSSVPFRGTWFNMNTPYYIEAELK